MEIFPCNVSLSLLLPARVYAFANLSMSIEAAAATRVLLNYIYCLCTRSIGMSRVKLANCRRRLSIEPNWTIYGTGGALSQAAFVLANGFT